MFGIFACWVFQKPGFNQFSFVQDENELLDINIYTMYIYLNAKNSKITGREYVLLVLLIHKNKHKYKQNTIL